MADKAPTPNREEGLTHKLFQSGINMVTYEDSKGRPEFYIMPSEDVEFLKGVDSASQETLGNPLFKENGTITEYCRELLTEHATTQLGNEKLPYSTFFAALPTRWHEGVVSKEEADEVLFSELPELEKTVRMFVESDQPDGRHVQVGMMNPEKSLQNALRGIYRPNPFRSSDRYEN